MKKFYVAAAILVTILMVGPAYAQEDIVNLADDAFKDRQRPAAVFPHDQHNEKAQIDECNVCHHVYEDGNKVEDDSSEGQGCADCHSVEEEHPTRPLMEAYHDLCTGCHGDKGAGPVTCGECHPRP